MENTIIFEIIKIRRESKDGYVVVDYNLEGTAKNKLITYWELIDRNDFKKTREDIESLSDADLTSLVRKYLFDLEKVSMIIEVRKLRDKVTDLEKRLSSAKTGTLLIKATLIDTFAKYRNEAMESNTSRSMGELTMIDHTLYHANKLEEWFYINVIPENRQSA